MDELVHAVEVLRAGGLVAFPTETVYGLGADAANGAAVERIFTVKGRPTGHPLIVHIRSADDLDVWASEVPAEARVMADAFWPGPLTMILRRTDRVPSAVTGGRHTVGLRVPDHPVALELLEAFGGGIAAPSANRFGAVSPTTAAHVRHDLGDDIDCILDGGPCVVGVESTIVDLTGAEPEVLRPGGITIERLTEVLGRAPRMWTDNDSEGRAPGMLRSHYTPRAIVEIVDAAEVVLRSAALSADAPSSRIGVLSPWSIDNLPDSIVELEPAGGPDEYAGVLYERLRQADRLGLDVLLVVAPPAEGVGVAVNDRLRRAAADDHRAL